MKDLLNKVIQGDCIEVMKRIPDKSIDLVLTDPPYGMDYQSSWRTDKYDKIANDVSLDWLDTFLTQAYRVLKDDTHIYLFCNDFAISDFRKALERAAFNPKRALVWVKNNHTIGDLEGDYGNKTEFIVWGHKGRRELNGHRDTNVIQERRQATDLHPTQKPIDLMSYFIEKSSKPNEIIIDPFLGSGTTAVACKQLNRNFIGIEISSKYCEIARKRLEATPTPLF